jgi:hypothetical protein
MWCKNNKPGGMGRNRKIKRQEAEGEQLSAGTPTTRRRYPEVFKRRAWRGFFDVWTSLRKTL